MIAFALQASYYLLTLGLLLGLIRFVRGPDILNRILAFDYCCACVLGLVAVYSFQVQSGRYLELVMIFSLLGFATVICFMEVFFARVREEESE